MVHPTAGPDRAGRAERWAASVSLAMLLLGVAPVVAAEVAYAAAPPKPRCKVVPGPKPKPVAVPPIGTRSPSVHHDSFVVTVPHLVCRASGRPVVIGGQGGGNAQGGGAPGSAGGGGIPFTGFDFETTTEVGLLALVSGVVALFLGRRRRGKSSMV